MKNNIDVIIVVQVLLELQQRITCKKTFQASTIRYSIQGAL
jgi:hypothetical protein